MADTSIEWTEKVWNPVTGCTKVSQGCKNCYAERVFPRAYGKDRKFTDVLVHPDRFGDPISWKKPCRIFVNSMSDLFHEAVPFDAILAILAHAVTAQRHTYQILTKRPQRMLEFVRWMNEESELRVELTRKCFWWGVSVEDQKTADERIPLLLQTPAAVRWISYEPALGPVDLRLSLSPLVALLSTQKLQLTAEEIKVMMRPGSMTILPPAMETKVVRDAKLDWVVCGGESGPNARPMHPDWARSVRDQCQTAGVPFFFKQWGEWAPGECADNLPTRTERVATWFANKWDYETLTPRESEETHSDDAPDVYRLGKKAAGRLLDGREWSEYPVDR